MDRRSTRQDCQNRTHPDAKLVKEGLVDRVKDRVICLHGFRHSWKDFGHQKRERQLVPGTETEGLSTYILPG